MVGEPVQPSRTLLGALVTLRAVIREVAAEEVTRCFRRMARQYEQLSLAQSVGFDDLGQAGCETWRERIRKEQRVSPSASLR